MLERITFRKLKRTVNNINNVFEINLEVMQVLYPNNRVEGYSLFRRFPAGRSQVVTLMNARETMAYLDGIMWGWIMGRGHLSATHLEEAAGRL